MRNEKVLNKLKELVELAEKEDETNVQIVILSLIGASISNDEGLLAIEVQKFVKDVLLPKACNDLMLGRAKLN